MYEGVAIEDVQLPTHLEFFAEGVPALDDDAATGSSRRHIEIYTGWVVLSDCFDNSGSAELRVFKTFLPVSKLKIRSYGDGSAGAASPDADLVVTVNTALSATDTLSPKSSVGLSNATVSLEPQSFPDVAGNPLCLVLEFMCSVHYARINKISYSVTTSTRRLPSSPVLSSMEIPAHIVPA